MVHVCTIKPKSSIHQTKRKTYTLHDAQDGFSGPILSTIGGQGRAVGSKQASVGFIGRLRVCDVCGMCVRSVRSSHLMSNRSFHPLTSRTAGVRADASEGKVKLPIGQIYTTNLRVESKVTSIPGT